jgi:hypothetical protein
VRRVVDEGQYAALADGRLRRRDRVYETEPPTGSLLLDAPNTVLTLHLGASTTGRCSSRPGGRQISVPDDPGSLRVNAPLLTPETAQAIAPYLPWLRRWVASSLARGTHPTVEIAGDLAAHDAAITAHPGGGLLETATTERVIFVNDDPREVAGHHGCRRRGGGRRAPDADRRRWADGHGRRHRRGRRAAPGRLDSTRSTWHWPT